jgi:hypothetical protein
MPASEKASAGGLWDFWQDQVIPGAVFLYQVAALLVFAVVPVLASRWLAAPSIGAFTDHQLVRTASHSSGWEAWAARPAGPLAGYQIRSIAGQPVSNSDEMRFALDRFRPGDLIEIGLRAPDGSPAVERVVLQFIPTVDRWAGLYIPYLVGLFFMLSSIWVFSLRRSDAAGRAFAIFAASAAIGLAGLFDLYTTHRLTYFWTLAIALAGGTLFNLALLFPQELRLIIRHPFLANAGYLPAGALALYAFSRLDNTGAYFWAWRLEFIFAVFAALFFLARTAVRRFASPSPIAREQARLILAGAAVAFGPLAVWGTLAIFGVPVAFPAYLLLPLAVFPLVIAYAILRYRLLNAEILFGRAILYALLLALLILSYLLLVTGFSLVAGDLLEPDHPYLIGGLVILLAALLN